MKIKVSEATPLQLDWLVATCEGRPELHDYGTILPWTTKFAPSDGRGRKFHPTTNWAQGGPIIERENILLYPHLGKWECYKVAGIMYTQFGETPLVAAMRCFVASKWGDEVHIPRELE